MSGDHVDRFSGTPLHEPAVEFAPPFLRRVLDLPASATAGGLR